ncbi:MAG: NADH-quinone oxidoreductase subunit A [Aigarchaeota archaeon]|nr:NADH-quinone oxidoreductase subunit A [Aigarchaeota archaeon]MDW7986139.1 NADH-quinone oxidoreductase subunit A [Nitrososphaerota archaeon]
MSPLFALTLYIVFAVATVVIMALVPLILAPWKPMIKKKISFECGQTPFPWREEAFPYEYFPYLIIYVAYAVIGVVVFLSSIVLVEAPHLADRILILFGSLTVGAFFIGIQLRELKQKLVAGRGE